MSIIRPIQLDSTIKPSRVSRAGIWNKSTSRNNKNPHNIDFHNILHKESDFNKEFDFPFSSNWNQWQICLSKPKEKEHQYSQQTHPSSSLSVFSCAIPGSKKSSSLCTRYRVSYEPGSCSLWMINWQNTRSVSDRVAHACIPMGSVTVPFKRLT